MLFYYFSGANIIRGTLVDKRKYLNNQPDAAPGVTGTAANYPGTSWEDGFAELDADGTFQDGKDEVKGLGGPAITDALLKPANPAAFSAPPLQKVSPVWYNIRKNGGKQEHTNRLKYYNLWSYFLFNRVIYNRVCKT